MVGIDAVVDDVVRGCETSLAIQLRPHDRVDFGRRGAVARAGAGALHVVGDIDHQDTIDEVALARLQQQRDDRQAIRRSKRADAPPHFRINSRMENVLKNPPLGGVLENEFPQLGAVERAIGVKDAVAEMFDDFPQAVAAGGNHVTRDVVGVNDRHTEHEETTCNGGFAATDAAGETNDEHGNKGTGAACPVQAERLSGRA